MSDEIYFDSIRYISSGEAAQQFNITRAYVARLASLGNIQGRRVGKNWYVVPESISGFLGQQKVATDHRIAERTEKLREEYRCNTMPSAQPALAYASAPEPVIVSEVSMPRSQVLPPRSLVARSPARMATSTRTYVALLAIAFVGAGAFAVRPATAFELAEGVRHAMTASAALAQDLVSGKAFTEMRSGMPHGAHTSAFAAAGALAADSSQGVLQNIARSFNAAINDFLFGAMFSTSATPDPASSNSVTVNVVPHTNTIGTSTPTPFAAATTSYPSIPQKPIAQTIINQPVIERIVETQRIVTEGGITEALLDQKLQHLDNKLASQIYSISAQSSATNAAVSQSYQVIAQSTKIDQLANTTITNPTISGGSISGASISGASISGSSLTVSGDVSLGNATTSSLNVTGTATSTFGGGVQTKALNVTSTAASSTFANGIVIQGGCVLVNGACLGSATVAGADTQVQFNNAGTLGGSSAFTFSTSSARLSITAASTSIFSAFNGIFVGGTATTSIYGSATSTFGAGISATALNLSSAIYGAGLSNCSATNKKLLYDSSTGQFTCGNDLQGSGGAGAFATTTDDLAIYPADTSDVVLIGTAATSTTGNILEVLGSSLFRSAVNIYGVVTGRSFTATSTTVASIFPLASSTVLSVGNGSATTTLLGQATSTFGSGVSATALNITSSSASSTFANGLVITGGCVQVNGACLTSSASMVAGANTWNALQTFSSGFIAASSTISGGLFTAAGGASTTNFTASGTGYFATASTTNLTVSGAPSGILTTNSTGVVSASTTIGVNFGGTGSTTLTGILKGNGTGSLLSAVAGSDYESPLTFSTGLTRTTNTITLDTTGAYAWSALQKFNAGASTTLLSVYNGLFVGGSATTSIYGSATSTFGAGIAGTALNVTGAASSTFANGLVVVGGCVLVNGSCLTANTGTVTSITANSGLTGGAITGSGTITLDMANANIWTALQTFSKASSTLASVITALYVGDTATTTIKGSATSTFGAGVSATALNVTSTSASSTFANGIILTGGCLLYNGACLTASGGSGADAFTHASYAGQTTSATSSTLWLTNGTLSLAASSSVLTYASSTAFTATTGYFTTASTTNLTVSGTGTSTFNGGVQTTAFNVTGSATSTAANGFNIAAGCFSINGNCIGGSGGVSLSAANTWTALQTFSGGASSSIFSSIGGIFIGDTATTSIYGSATSTFGAGIAGTYLNITGTAASSTFANGINLAAGCFSVNGTCVTAGGGSGTVNSGTQGYFPYYETTGTALTATSSFYISTAGRIGIGSTTPWAMLSINGNSQGSGIAQFLVGSSTATNFVVTSGGSVGIGTTTPIGQFTVNNFGPTFGRVGSGTINNSGINTSAFVYVQGKYAYTTAGVGGSNAFQVWDVSNPASPLNISSKTLNGGQSGGGIPVVVQGRYAYMVQGAGSTNTFEIWDVANPNAPARVSQSTVNAGNNAGAGLYVQGRYAYISLGAQTTNGFEIWDIGNPYTPVKVGTGSKGVGNSWAGDAVFVQGNFAYISAGSSGTNGFEVWDVSNPTNPARVGRGSSSIASSNARNGLYVQGRYAYIAQGGGTTNAFEVWDVASSSNPFRVGSATLAQGDTSSGSGDSVYVQGRYAYVTEGAGSTNAFQVIDVSNPASPVVVKSASLPNGGSDTGNGIFVQGRYAYIVTGAGTTNSFTVWDIGGAYVQQLEAGGIETGTLSARNIFGADAVLSGGLTTGAGINAGGSISILGASTTANASSTIPSLFRIATASSTNPIFQVLGTGGVGVGTSTPFWALTVASSTGPQFALVDGTLTSNAWTMRSISNSLYFATSTVTATSTTAALAFDGTTGAATFGSPATTTFTGGAQTKYLNVTGTAASSTFANGIVVTGGCVQVNGACLGSGTVTSVTAGTGLSGGIITGSGTIALDTAISNTWSALQIFNAGASTTVLSVGNGSATTTLLGQATSTFGAGIAGTALNVTGAASSTFANGIILAGGCVSVNGACLTAASGSSAGDSFTHASYSGQTTSATSSTLWLTNGTLSLAASSSVLTYASSTAFSVSGTGFFGTASTTNLTVSGAPSGILVTDSTGAVSASSTLAINAGGTGLTSYTAGDILYANSGGKLTALGIGGSGLVLKVSGGLPTWQTDNTSAGSAGLFATSTDNLRLYAADSSQVLIFGGTATTTTGNILETIGNALFRNNVVTYGSNTAPSFTATSTSAASTFVLASTTRFSALTSAAFGATATSSFDSAGALTLASALTVGNGGTGQTSFTSGNLLYGSGTNGVQNVATTTATIGGSLSYSGTFGALVGGAAGTLSLNMGNANTWTALQLFSAASSTQLSVFNKAYFGATATTTIDSAGNVVVAGTLDVTGKTTLGNASTTRFSALNSAAFGATATSSFSSAGALSMAGDITFAVDNQNDIGASGATRPRAVYVGSSGIHSGQNVEAAASGQFFFTGRTTISSASDGVLLVQNNGATDFSRLQLGGTSASFPSIKRNAAGIDFRLADDSGYANIAASAITANGLLSTTYASTTILSASNGSATTTIIGNATSTFGAGINGSVLNISSATASSTFANGIVVAGGCVLVNGACLGVGSVTSVSAGNGLTGGPITSSGSLAIDFTRANTWSALQQFSAGASTTQLSVYNKAYFGATATSSFDSTGALTLTNALTYGGVTLSNAVTGTGNLVLSASPTLTGTLAAAAATFSGTTAHTGLATFGNASSTVFSVGNGSATTTLLGQATSTFGAGVSATALNITSATASSTFANGLIVAGGCVTVNGACLTANAGTVTSVTAGAGLTGGAITGSGTITLDMATANVWTALQTFNAASTTRLSVLTSAAFGATATSSFDSAGALTLASALTVGNGGTGQTSFTSGNLLYGSGTNGVQNVATTSATIGGSLSYSGTFGALVGGAAGTLSLNMGNANTWTALQVFNKASSTLASVISGLFVGDTATTSIYGSATSTFGAGIAGTALNVTGTASSTFANGLVVAGGCVTVNGACLTANAGTVTSVGVSSSGSITVGSTPVTSSGTITADLNMANPNIWTALQTFSSASTTRFSALNSAAFGATATSTFDSAGNLTLAGLTSAVLGVDNTGKVVATSSIGVNLLTANTISGVTLGGTLGALTATDASLTFSAAYNGSAARTVGVNFSNANTWNALQLFAANASSSQLSIFQKAYFGATATSTFDSAGNLALVANGLTVGSSQFVVAGNTVGIGTSSPYALLSVSATSTTGTGSPRVLFAVASSTAGTATTTLFQISNTGVASTTNITVSGAPNGILATDATGAVTASTTIGLNFGGTGATTAAGARTNLGAAASGTNIDITSLAALIFASTTRFSVFDKAYFGGSSTSTFDSTGSLVINTSGSVTSNTVYGGSSNSSSLALQSTSGAGSSDKIQFLTGSAAEAARFTTNGNLLVGTTTGTRANLIIGSSTAPQLALSDNTAGSNLWTFRSISNNFYIATSTASATSSTSALSITSNSFVGIATDTPAQRFSVAGNIYGTGSLGVGISTPTLSGKAEISDASAATTTALVLSNYQSATSTASRLTFRANDISAATSTASIMSVLQQNYNGGKGDLAFSTLNAGTLTEGMRLTSQGFLGIATTSPYRTLSVALTGGTAGPQVAIGYDQTHNATLYNDSSGYLRVHASGQQALLPDDNLWVCTGGTELTNGCPSGLPSGQGNLFVENKFGIGTSTLGVAGANNAFTIDLNNDSTTNLFQISTSSSGYGSVTSLFTIPSSGYVGIASSTPFARLAIGAGGAIVTTEASSTKSTSFTVNWLQGNQQKFTINSSIGTISFTNFISGQILRLILCQGGSGNITLPTFSPAVIWASHTAPTLSTTAGQCDLLTMVATGATSTDANTVSIFGGYATGF